MSCPFGHTPHFTIRVRGLPCSKPEWWDDVAERIFQRTPHPVQELCDIEVDTTTGGSARVDIVRYQGLEVINQKMLTRSGD